MYLGDVESVAELFNHAESCFANGDWEQALRGYSGVIEVAPRFTPARYRVADCLLNLGDSELAKTVYRSLAWHYIRSGHPLLGLVLCKMLTALEPKSIELLEILAELYSSESERVAEAELPQPPPLPDGAAAPELSEAPGPELRESAAELAADTESITETPANFPHIPLFSHLDEATFVRILHRLRLRRFQHDDIIVREGERGDSFFMLGNGQVTVWKILEGRETLLARLHQGAIFGEMALVSSQPRAATVRAVGDVDLLELSRADIETQAEELETVAAALKRFTRGRFLANLAATSPLFRTMDKEARRRVIALFESEEVVTGDVLIEEGEAGPGLFLVLRGEFKVSRRVSGTERRLAILRSGQVFGEISLLKDVPTTATVTAVSLGEVLKLDRTRFESVLRDFPELWTSLHALSEKRLEEQRRIVGPIATGDDQILL
jgi:CRP-like cAMP-binding protein